ncbi:MAG: FkbM family methyltransferase [Chthoniobacterales bacterium]
MKPCYIFAPRQLVRRIYLQFAPAREDRTIVPLPWGGEMEVDLRDAIGSEIQKQGIFDLAVSECAWRLLQPGDHVIDAGANIGYMTRLFSGKVGPAGFVHAFEPHPEVGARLQRNVGELRRADGSPRVIVHRCALGKTSGVADLFESDYFSINQGTASIANVPADPAAPGFRRHQVAVTTLDDSFPSESFKLLKIDVEGFEAQVLQGAEQLLGSQRVRHVIYEDHTLGQSGLAQILAGHGYAIFAIGHSFWGPALLESTAAESAIDVSWESASFLATRDSAEATRLMKPRGWRVLRGA